MLEAFTLARMLQKFADKKKSVHYSHPPIVEKDGSAMFKCHDGTGRVLKVWVREWTVDEELDEAVAAKAERLAREG